MASINVTHEVDIDDEDLVARIIKEIGPENVLAEIKLSDYMQRAMYWMPYTFSVFIKHFKEYMRSIEDKDLDELLLVLVELKETRREERGS